MDTCSTDLLTENETALLLRVKRQTLSVWRCTKRVALPFVRVGRAVRYRRSDVDSFLAAARVVPAGAA
jgi:excisionase family DNA binding protein